MEVICPQCKSEDLFESCWKTHPFRVTFCRCGWDNLEKLVRMEREKVLEYLEGLPSEVRSVDHDEMVRGLKDPAVEKQLIESIRNR